MEQKRILLVDDDPLVLRVYQQGLSARGFTVETAEDGLKATKALVTRPPDAMVLDLMMPRLSGDDVLKFLQTRSDLGSIPIVVLSNFHMEEVAKQAAASGVRRALLKVRCTPALLASTLCELLGIQPSHEEEAPPPEHAARPPLPISTDTGEFRMSAREDFLNKASSIAQELRTLLQGFLASRNDGERELRMQALYRKVHFLSATAGFAECHMIAQLASAYEALLFGLMGRPELVTLSMQQTLQQALSMLVNLLGRAADPKVSQEYPPPSVLVVDDNAVSTRLVVAGLLQVGLKARSVLDPVSALAAVQQRKFDMLMFDVEMPGMSGLDLCRKVRALPDYERTPIIFVTSHSDFETRSKTVLSGGNDLISKPVFPMELAAKAVMHLLRRRLES